MGFNNDKFGWALFTFDSNGFVQVRDVLMERYGQPHLTNTTEVKNRMNATFTNQKLDWKGELVGIHLARYSDTLTKSSLLIGLLESMKSSEEKVKVDNKKAAEKL